MKYIRKKQQKMSLRKNPPEHIYKNIIFSFQQKKRPYPWHPPRTQAFHPFPICISSHSDTIPCDLLQRSHTAHCHRIFQFASDLIDISLDAFLRSALHGSHKRAGNDHRIGSQCQCLKHIHTGTDASVDKNLHGAIDCICDLFEHLCGGRTLIQNTPAVV